jgi:Peptidase family S41
MHKLLVILFIFFANSLQAQTTFTIEDQSADFDELYQNLLINHPKIGTAADSLQLQVIYDSIKKTFVEGASQEQALNKYAVLLNSIGCGHTAFATPRNKKEKQRALPIKLKYIETKAIVMTAAEGTIPKGACIDKINNISIADWIKRMAYFNGGVDNNREEVKIQSILDEMVINRNMLYANANRVSIEYTLGAETKKDSIDFVSWDSAMQVINDFDEDRLFPLYYFMDTTYKTMYVKVSSFLYDMMHPATAIEMAKEMDEENFDNVIIDLRGNGGGSVQFGQYFLGHFLKDSVFVFDTIAMKQTARASFMKNIFYKLFYKKSEAPYTKSDIWIYRKQEKNIENFNGFIARQRINFAKKKLFVLIDNASFSMAPICAQLLKNDGAILIGEEAAGRGYLNYAILVNRLSLKKTKLDYSIPFFKGITNAATPVDKSKNLMPTYLVKWTLQDVKNKKDPCIEKVKELLK